MAEQKMTQEEHTHMLEVERMEKILIEMQLSMNTAIDAANIFYFEYYPEENYALEFNGRESLSLDERMDNYPDSWFEKEITHPEDVQILREAFDKIKNGSEHEQCLVRNKLDGTYLWHHYTFTSIYNSEGVRTKVVCTAQDETENIEAKGVNAQYRQLYQRAPGWIFRCRNDENWTLTETNPRILEFTGYTEAEFAVEKNNSIAAIIPEPYRKSIRQTVEDLTSQEYGAKATYDMPFFHRDGTQRWVSVNLYWEETNGKSLLNVFCSDITDFMEERKQIEEERRYQEKVEDPMLLMKSRCNITTDEVELLYTVSELHMAFIDEKRFSDGISQLKANVYSKEDEDVLTNALMRWSFYTRYRNFIWHS